MSGQVINVATVLDQRLTTGSDDGTGTTPCVIWSGRLNRDGYGIQYVNAERQYRLAHRLAYERVLGPVPDGLELDHTCNVRACVEIAHLEAVTHAENKRRERDRRTHCRAGLHPLDVANTSWSRKGQRRCRACRAAWARADRRNRKAS